MAETGTDIHKAAALLTRGALVAIPTETVYGLAANALDGSAVARVFEAKNRPHFDPLIVHVPDLDSVRKYAVGIPDAAVKLAEAFWPGPLTLVLPKAANIPDLTSAGLDTIGLRCPDHPLTQALLRLLEFPLAAPSANPFGYVSPTTAQHVARQLGERIDYILDGGPCNVGIESTIIGFENGQPVVYRFGGLSLESITQVIGNVVSRTHSTSDPRTPGQLKSHYAPAKKIVIGSIEALRADARYKTAGVIAFRKNYGVAHQIILSPSGSIIEAARNLFSALRAIEDFPVDVVLVEYVPHEGIGRAINDRLTRAAHR